MNIREEAGAGDSNTLAVMALPTPFYEHASRASLKPARTSALNPAGHYHRSQGTHIFLGACHNM